MESWKGEVNRECKRNNYCTLWTIEIFFPRHSEYDPNNPFLAALANILAMPLSSCPRVSSRLGGMFNKLFSSFVTLNYGHPFSFRRIPFLISSHAANQETSDISWYLRLDLRLGQGRLRSSSTRRNDVKVFQFPSTNVKQTLQHLIHLLAIIPPVPMSPHRAQGYCMPIKLGARTGYLILSVFLTGAALSILVSMSSLLVDFTHVGQHFFQWPF